MNQTQHTSTMRTIFLYGAALFLLAAPSILFAHAAGGQPPLPQPPDPKLSAAFPQDAEKILDELRLRFPHELTEEERNRIVQIYNALQEAKTSEKDLDEKVAELEKVRSDFEEYLKTLSITIQFDVSGENAEPLNSRVREVKNRESLALLYLNAGEGPQRNFIIQEHDMDLQAPSTYERAYNFPHPGRSFVYIHFTSIPYGTNRHDINFVPIGDSTKMPASIEFRAPEPGRLKLEILDEAGEATPVGIRMIIAGTPLIIGPPNHMDFTEQQDPSVAHVDLQPEGPHYANIPGPLIGHHWIVPEGFDMSLPPGNYHLQIRKGIEYIPIDTMFSIEEGETTSLAVNMQRWINMPEKGWISGDIHVHSQLMNSTDARQIMVWAKAADVHVSNLLQMGDIDRVYYQQVAFGKEARYRDGDYVLVPGQEGPRYLLGHAIMLNLGWEVRDASKYVLNDLAADAAHESGGLYGYAHLATPMFDVHRDMTMTLLRGKADFAEIMQFRQIGTEHYYDFLDLGFSLTAAAGSDVPYSSSLGDVRTYVYIDEKEWTADDWFESFKKGHTFVSTGPMLEFTVNGELPGSYIELEKQEDLTVEAKVAGLKDHSRPVKLELIKFGQTIHEMIPESDDQTELTFEKEVPSGDGCWIALRAEGEDGSLAHTTPVYISVDGSRSWNRERVEELIQDRRETVDEIEAILEQCVAISKSGYVHPEDQHTVQFAENEQALRERFKIVRSILDSLEDEFKEQNK